MKILQQRTGLSTERGERSQQADNLGSERSGGDFRSRQVGLDRIDVSRTSETAAAVVDYTLRQRQERVAALAAQFQSGNYQPNLSNLSQAILNEDADVDLAHVG